MDDGFVQAYLKHSAAVDVGFIENAIATSHYVLERPGTDQVWGATEVGDHRTTTRAELEVTLRERRNSGLLQVWEADPDDAHPCDTYFSVRFEPQVTVIEFSKLPRPPYALLSGMWELFANAVREAEAVAFISDPHADSADHVNWDDVIIRRRKYEGPSPELICLPAGDIDTLVPGHWRAATMRDFLVVWQR